LRKEDIRAWLEKSVSKLTPEDNYRILTGEKPDHVHIEWEYRGLVAVTQLFIDRYKLPLRAEVWEFMDHHGDVTCAEIYLQDQGIKEILKKYGLEERHNNGISICVTDSIDEVSDILASVYRATKKGE